MSKKYKATKSFQLPPVWRAVLPWVAAVVYFLVVCLSSPSTAKGTAVVCILGALAGGVYCVIKRPARLTLPLAVLSLLVVMDGISTLYAVSGKFALNEYLKIIIAFGLAVMLLAFTGGEGVAPGRKIATILERCAALLGLVSIDLLSTRVISSILLFVPRLFSNDYKVLDGVEVGTRMTSMLNNPNVFAGCVGIGVLLSLGLVLSSEKKGERMTHAVCLFINALSFVLAFSMGASAMILLAFVVYLLLEFKGRRPALLVLMMETLVVTFVAVLPISMTSFTVWDGFRPIPLLCVIAGAAALCLLDWFVGRRLGEVLAGHGKLLLGMIVGLLAALAVFAVVAVNLTGPASLKEGERLYRSVYPEPGEYTVTSQANARVTVIIESQSRQDTMMHTSTELYRGDLEKAAFVVPEDSVVVKFTFLGREDSTVVDSVTCEGASTVEIPLNYKLLPGFISTRLQGLRANQNATQRLVFFEDGMKLFRLSPVIGRGLGSYENGVQSVQSFYYETKYAHNHYIQVLTETGVVGLVLFVGLLLLSAAVVLLARRKKEEAHPLVPALGAALVFMAGHAAVEVVFSTYAYLALAFGVFALIALCCGDAVPVAWWKGKVRIGFFAGVGVLVFAFFILLCGNLSAKATAGSQGSFATLEQAAKTDVYEWADYAASYIINIEHANGNARVLAQADQYAARLSELQSNSVSIYVAHYYFSTGQIEKGLDMVAKYVSYVPSDPDTWETAFNALEMYAEDTDEYRAGVERVVQIARDWDEANIGTITFDEDSQAFLAEMGL